MNETLTAADQEFMADRLDRLAQNLEMLQKVVATAQEWTAGRGPRVGLVPDSRRAAASRWIDGIIGNPVVFKCYPEFADSLLTTETHVTVREALLATERWCDLLGDEVRAILARIPEAETASG